MIKAVFIFLALIIVGYTAAAFFNPDLNRRMSALLPSFIVERAKSIFGLSDDKNNGDKTNPFAFFDADNEKNDQEKHSGENKDGKEKPFYAPIYLPIKEKMESLPKFPAEAGQAAAEAKEFVSQKVQSLTGAISEGVSTVKEKAEEKIVKKTVERLLEGLDEKNRESLREIICAPAPR